MKFTTAMAASSRCGSYEHWHPVRLEQASALFAGMTDAINIARRQPADPPKAPSMSFRSIEADALAVQTIAFANQYFGQKTRRSIGWKTACGAISTCEP